MSTLLSTLLNSEPKQTFYKLSVHTGTYYHNDVYIMLVAYIYIIILSLLAALTSDYIESYFEKIINFSQEILEYSSSVDLHQGSIVPSVVVSQCIA